VPTGEICDRDAFATLRFEHIPKLKQFPARPSNALSPASEGCLAITIFWTISLQFCIRNDQLFCK
jgi:hypothetical protein